METVGRLSGSQIQKVLGDLSVGDAEEAWLAAQKQGSFQLLAVGNAGDNLSINISSNMISDWAQTLRDCCRLLKWILHDEMPMFDLHPEASFDFCGFLMLQKGYYSFKKKGQLVS